MSAYTLAPWTCDEEGLVAGLDRVHLGSPSFDIFDASEWPGGEQEGLANARLIAAAPDMLEALEQAADEIDRLTKRIEQLKRQFRDRTRSAKRTKLELEN